MLWVGTAEATGQSRPTEEGEGRGFGMPGRDAAAPFVRGGGGGFLRRSGPKLPPGTLAFEELWLPRALHSRLCVRG